MMLVFGGVHLFTTFASLKLPDKDKYFQVYVQQNFNQLPSPLSRSMLTQDFGSFASAFLETLLGQGPGKVP